MRHTWSSALQVLQTSSRRSGRVSAASEAPHFQQTKSCAMVRHYFTRHCLQDGRTRELALVVLVELTDALPDRAWYTAPDRLAIQARNRQRADGCRANEDLVGMAQLRHADRHGLERN